MAIDIRDLDDEVTIYYTCPHCEQVSGIIINEEPFEHGHDQHQLFCCEHCEGFSEIWILPSELASKIRRTIKGEAERSEPAGHPLQQSQLVRIP